MEKKITYVQALDNAIAVTGGETRERLEALKLSLERRNSHRSDKPTKAQVENEGVKVRIMEVLADGAPRQCKDVAEVLEITGQKCSALLKQLVDGGKVEKFTEKRVTYFKVAEGE